MKKNNRRAGSDVRAMVECALMIAVGTILAQLVLYKLPNGGAVTVASMVPFILISFREGTRWGIISGLANSLLQMLIGGIYPPPAGTFAAFAGEIVLDYVLAFTVLSLAKFFSEIIPWKNKAVGVLFGTFVVCFLRFLCSFVSGFLIWASLVSDGFGAVIYSLGYNLSYMIPETLISMGVIYFLYKSFPGLFSAKK